ncbi:MAG: glycosyltransferase family 4 protein [Candidatus Diapherotrites archaeon]
MNEIVSPCYFELVNEMKRQGHEIIVLNENGSFGNLKAIKCTPAHVTDYPSGAFNKILFSAKARQIIEKMNIDLIFGSFPESICFLGDLKIPKIVMLQDDLKKRIQFTPWFGMFKIKYGFIPLPEYTKIGVKIDYLFQLNSLKKADGIVFVNNESKKEFNGKTRALAKAIPNGVNSKQFSLDKNTRKEIKKIKKVFPGPIVLFMARLELQKAPLDFVRAAGKVLQRHKAFFLIAGNGPMRKAVEKEIHKLNLTERVKVLGWKKGTEKKALLHSCSMYVLSSLFDPMPISVLEAMACSKPVIVSNVGGIKEAVDEKVGIKIPSGNIEKLVDAIIFMLESPEKAKAMGINAKKKIERFYDWKAISKKYIEFFNEVSSKNG